MFPNNWTLLGVSGANDLGVSAQLNWSIFIYFLCYAPAYIRNNNKSIAYFLSEEP
jgi:hypothetical protein